MHAVIDHVVLWVEDPLRSLEFYTKVVGLEPVRAEEFIASKAPFPSVRLSPAAILDLMPRSAAPMVNALAKKAAKLTHDAAGHLVNHVCLATDRTEYLALRGRLEAAGVDTSFVLKESFGARGIAGEAFYFPDPDGNILEARWY